MQKLSIRDRLRYAWGVLLGRYAITPTPVEGIFIMSAFPKTDASLATLQATVDRAVALLQDASNQAIALADADDTMSAAIDTVNGSLLAAAPPPANEIPATPTA